MSARANDADYCDGWFKRRRGVCVCVCVYGVCIEDAPEGRGRAPLLARDLERIEVPDVCRIQNDARAIELCCAIEL